MGKAIDFGIAVAAVLAGIWLSSIIPNPLAKKM